MTRNVWSTDSRPPNRRGWFSARGRSGSAFFIVAAVAIAAYIWWPASKYDCETLVGQSLAKLDSADQRMKSSASGGVTAKCTAYRERVSALAELAKLPAACGPPPKRSGAWPSPNDERKWYENLIFEECR